MAILRVYLDESGTHEGAALTCSAGYVFTEEGSAVFQKEWEPFLASKGLKWFHASEVWRRPDANEMFTKLRDIIKQTAERGFIRFILSAQIDSLRTRQDLKPFTGSGYSLLTISCMNHIADYAKSRGDQVCYFIESGDSNEKEFKEFVRKIDGSDKLRERFAFHNASLTSKEEGIHLQAADLLSWTFGRVEKEQWVPGFEDFKDWLDWYWYSKDHLISGYSETSFQIQAMVNAFHGLRVP
jgi:hypothetical protein